VIADLSNNQSSSGAWFFLTGHDGIVTMTGVGHRSVEDITNVGLW
jgi:hypothetical protein